MRLNREELQDYDEFQSGIGTLLKYNTFKGRSWPDIALGFFLAKGHLPSRALKMVKSLNLISQ